MRNVAKWLGATVGYTAGAVIAALALAKDVEDRDRRSSPHRSPRSATGLTVA